MLTITNLTKKYGKTIANNNLTLTIDSGKLTVLLGPNGAGKTTLIKAICGLHCPNSGKISVNGLDHEDVEARKLIAYAPEHPQLYDYLTLNEHLNFILKGYGKEVDLADYDQLIKDFQMDSLRKKLVKDFSNGQKQKASLLMALVLDTPILILDEPFNGLDPESVVVFKDLLSKLADEGKTILLSTHLLDVAQTIADCYKIIRNGVIVAEPDNSGDILSIYLESGK